MEWPTLDILQDVSEEPNFLTTEDEEYLGSMTMTLITKEIYARAAKAAVSNILVAQKQPNLKARVDAFVQRLRQDDDRWKASEYRNIAREFTELMTMAKPRCRTLEICRAGLDAVHDLLKYRVPGSNDPTLMVAKDAFVLCQSFDRFHTVTFSGTRAPDMEYRYGLQTEASVSDRDFVDGLSLYGKEACENVNALRNAGQIETSSASLACHTLTNPDLVHRLAKKTFVILGCDHPLSPAKTLLRIPGVNILGISTDHPGLEEIMEYATYNTPDNTNFSYPTMSSKQGYDDGNLVLSKGPHIAQWILENTKEMLDETDMGIAHPDSEIVLVPMPLLLPENNMGFSEMAIRWAASCDLILERVLRARSDFVKCSIWSYQSSSTCMVVPSASTTTSTELLLNRPIHEGLLHRLSMGTILTPVIDEDGNDDDNHSSTTQPQTPSEESPSTSLAAARMGDPNANHDYSIVNGIMTHEGPYHILAEHIRMWRAIVTNYPHEYHRYDNESDSEDDYSDDEGEARDPSRNVWVFAPYVPLLTPKHAPQNDARMLLEPLKVFDGGAAASLLCAVGLAGLVDPIVNRPMPIFEEATTSDNVEPSTPFAMFWHGSIHGGIWNCPYTLESANGTVGYVLDKVYEYYYYYYYNYTNNTTNTAIANKEIATTGADSSSKTTENEAIVDSVPGEMPDIVHDRLMMIANNQLGT